MRVVSMALEQSQRRIVGLVVLGLSMGAGLALMGFILMAAFGLRGASATHDGTGTVHVCVNRFTTLARFVSPGQAPNCTANEYLVQLGSGAATADVEARLSALEDQVPDCLSDTGDTALFTGCNVQIVNGLNGTATTNGTGNLIVGYNENFEEFSRSGSHNLVIGPDHGYSSYGGLVAGSSNLITGPSASVTGGAANTASAFASSVSGGGSNEASGDRSSVSGGLGNTASGVNATVSGGQGLTADDTNEHLP